MATLPEIIEIVPPVTPVQAKVSIPGSKSITNRALILAALQDRTTTIEFALWSEDTQIMVDSLKRLGYAVTLAEDFHEPSNRTITIVGKSSVPQGGTANNPLELFVGNAGTAARFLSAMLCLGSGVYRVSGVTRMHERPQAELFAALRELGYRIDAQSDRLPSIIYGAGPRPGHCKVSMQSSSQFASALLLAAHTGRWDVEVIGENQEEAPYVRMTREMAGAFRSKANKSNPAVFRVEPDASSASYFLAANYLLSKSHTTAGEILLANEPQTDWQVDSCFARHLPLPDVLSRARDLGDSILSAMIVAPFEQHPVRFADLSRLRVQECDRVMAMRTELSRCGAKVEERGDTLTVLPSPNLHGAEIETYDDHRIAMCFGVLGLAVPGMRIRNPACVKKTFPNFFQKLAAPPPEGLGITIRAVDSTARTSAGALQTRDLFAD